MLLGLVAVGWNDFSRPPGSYDMDQLWHASRAVLGGQDPYDVIGPGRPGRFPWPFYYPLTAAIASLPLALMSLPAARAVFVAVGAALVAFTLVRARPWAWPFLFSMPFVSAVHTMQLSPYLTAAMLLPGLGFLAAVKPNIGLVLMAQSRTKRQVVVLTVGGLLLLAVSLAVMPAWPVAWLRELRGADHFRPLLFRPGGFLLLLALLRWRDPEARLILALGIVPQTGMWYEALPVFLATRNRRQAAMLAVSSQAAFLSTAVLSKGEDFTSQSWLVGTLVVWAIMLPALAFVFKRPAERPEAMLDAPA